MLTASWWGGFFEICVKLVKRCLKKVPGNEKLSYKELESVLIETEGVLNSRALTYVYEELSEDTPSHLVIGRRLLDKPTASTESHDHARWHHVKDICKASSLTSKIGGEQNI